MQKYFKYGLKDLLDNGVVYYKAYHPHGVPETTPGHNGLSTGTCPKDHGAIANDWIGPNGEEVEYVQDPDFPSLLHLNPGMGILQEKPKLMVCLISLCLNQRQIVYIKFMLFL